MLEGKSVVITGAARGIGKGLALATASAGAGVVVTARTLAAAQTVVDEIASRGGRAVPFQCDVTDRKAVEGSVAAALEHFGRLDAMVHNAISPLSGQDTPLEAVSDEHWDEQVHIALRGAFYCAQASFEALRSTGGTYVVLTSTGGIDGSRDRPVYSAVKGAQRGFVKALAREWGPHGVRVNAIAPVAVTETMAVALETRPELAQYIKFGVSLGRLGDPEKDTGGALKFLIGPDSAFITGQTFLVDGGRTSL
jgi:3-oxoacyl-[acyl-carrier protein] reductase